MARPRPQASGTAVSATTGTLSPAWPTHLTNDVALLVVESADEAVTLSDAQGFSLVGFVSQPADGAANATRQTLFWCRATSASMTAPTIAAVADHLAAQILTFRSVRATGTPYSDWRKRIATVAGATVTFPPLNTPEPGCLVVVVGSIPGDAASTTSWATWSNTVDQFVTATAGTLDELADFRTADGGGGGFGVAAGYFPEMGFTDTSTAVVTLAWWSASTLAFLPEDVEVMPAALNPGHGLDGNTVCLWRFNEKRAGNGGCFDTAYDLVYGGGAFLMQPNASAGTPMICGGPVAGRPARRFPGNTAAVNTEVCYLYALVPTSTFVRDSLRDADWTIEAYVKVNGTPPGSVRGVFSYGNDSASDSEANNVVAAVGFTSSYRLFAFWENGVGVNNTISQTTGATLSDNLWHHIAVVRNFGAKTVDFYIDGVLEQTVAYSTDPTGGPSTGTVVVIGTGQTSTTVADDFQMCDLRISNTARSSGVIAADAALITTTCNHPLDSNTLLLYRFDEAPAALDLGSLGAHLSSFVTGANDRTWPTAPGGLIRDGGRGIVLNDTYLAMGHVSGLHAILDNDVTIEAWVLMFPGDVVTATESLGIFQNQNASAIQRNNGFGIEVQQAGTGRYVRAVVEHGAGLSTSGVVLAQVAIEPGVPFHIAFRKTMTGATWTGAIFVNGVKVQEDAALINFDGGNNSRYGQYLGLNLSNGNGFGVLDDVRISNIARTDAEILESYENGTSLGSGAVYRMRAYDSTLARNVFWNALDIDAVGASYGGPGPLSDVVVHMLLGT